MRFRLFGKKQTGGGDPMRDSLREAVEARKMAEQNLERDDRDVTTPLWEMHRVNHIGPLVTGLIREGRKGG